MSLDDPNKVYSKAEIGGTLESIHPPVKATTVRSTRKKVSVTVSETASVTVRGALATFQSTLLGDKKIYGVSCKILGNDIITISANTTRKKLLKALAGQKGVTVLEDHIEDEESYEGGYEEATEQVA